MSIVKPSMEISVALCTYNGEKFLAQQLKSIAVQTLAPCELVVRDDHSTDRTVSTIENFAKQAPFPIRLKVNEERVGSNENFARAIGDCRGDVIALSDQDDVWHPDKLAELARVLAEQPGVGLVFSDAALVDEELRPLGRTLWDCLPFPQEKQERLRSDSAFSLLLDSNVVTGAAAAFRSNFKDLVCPIPSHIPVGHDGWIALVIAAFASIEPVGKPLIDYRQHSNQQIGAPGIGRRRNLAMSSEMVESRREQQGRRLHLLECLEKILARSEENGMAPRLVNALRETRERESHLRARICLPQPRLRRLVPILTELLSGRYGRYSSGVRSAAADLIS